MSRWTEAAAPLAGGTPRIGVLGRMTH